MAVEIEPQRTEEPPKFIVWGVNHYGELSLPAEEYIKQREALQPKYLQDSTTAKLMKETPRDVKVRPHQQDSLKGRQH